MKKLSIVIPVYNGSKYISYCMENLQKQSFQDWKAFFVDDGSTDGSGEILDQLVKNDSRYHVIHQKNGGTARARNTGLDKADGVYVTFMDVDDELDSEMYEKLVRLMDETGADMGICGYYFKIENADGRNSYLERKSYPSCVLEGKEEICGKLVELWDRDMLSNVWNKFYRMKLIREKGLRYRDGHVYTEDRVFNRQFIENCSSIAVTEECLYYYVRERAGSTSERYREDYFIIRHKEYEEFQIHFKRMKIWNEVSREYVCREFTERIAGCIENIFHAGKNLTALQKYKKIQLITRHPDVRKAIKFARCRSLKMRIFVLPIRWNWALGAYGMGELIYLIRKSNPILFHKLKETR